MKTGLSRSKGIALMLLVTLLWSLGGVGVKGISWNALVISGARCALAALVLFAFMKAKGYRLTVNRWSLLAAIGNGGCLTFFCLANKFTTAANAIVLQYTAPIYILLLSALIFHRKIHRREVLVVVVAFLGMALFFFDQLSVRGLWGNLMGIVSGLFIALMFFCMGEAGEDEETRFSAMFMGNLLGAVVGLGTMVLYPVTSWESSEILLILMLGLLQIGLAYSLYSIASGACPPLMCSLIGMLETILNPLWVMLAFGEKPGPYALMGGSLLIGAVVVYLLMENAARPTDEKREHPGAALK